MDSRSPKQVAIDLRRRAKEFPYSSEDRKLLIAAAKTIEELEAKKRESIMDWIFSEDGEAFWEENGVPLTPEQKADLEQQRRILHRIDNDDE